MAHTFKTTAKVWISTYSHHDAASLQKADSLNGICVAEVSMTDSGYTHVGEADITVTIATPNQITGNKVASLRAELEKDRAESQRRQNQMVDKINKLEALTYEAPGAAA